jgi:hypothetical protein
MQITNLPLKLAALIDKVSPSLWSQCKTEAIDLTADFYWLDDHPTPNGRQVLIAHSRLDRWIEVRVDHDPDDLLRVRRILNERSLIMKQVGRNQHNFGDPPVEDLGHQRAVIPL